MKAPKILYIIGQLVKGGAEQQFYYLLQNLQPEARIISLANGGYWVNPIRELGYQVDEIGGRGIWGRANRLRLIYRIIRDYQPDIVHLFTDRLAGLNGRLAAIASGHPCVVVGMRSYPAADPAWYRQLKRFWLDHHVRLVIVNSKQAYDYLIHTEGYSPLKLSYIPNGIDLTRFEPGKIGDNFLPPSWHSGCIVGMVGSLRVYKNPQLFVQTARLVLDLREDVRFVLIGDGPMFAEVSQLVEDLGLGDKLVLAGARDDIAPSLPHFDIFLLTSRSEGTPNAIMEAMACGLPCIGTDVGDVSQLIVDGQTGYVVPSENAEALAQAVIQLVDHANLRHQMGQTGRERIRAYDASIMAQGYRDLYHRLLAGSDEVR